MSIKSGSLICGLMCVSYTDKFHQPYIKQSTENTLNVLSITTTTTFKC